MFEELKSLTGSRAKNLLNHLLLGTFLQLHVQFPDEDVIVLAASHGILAFRRKSDGVDMSLVARQCVDGPGLQQVVDLYLPVTGPRHAVVAAGVE